MRSERSMEWKLGVQWIEKDRGRNSGVLNKKGLIAGS